MCWPTARASSRRPGPQNGAVRRVVGTGSLRDSVSRGDPCPSAHRRDGSRETSIRPDHLFERRLCVRARQFQRQPTAPGVRAKEKVKEQPHALEAPSKVIGGMIWCPLLSGETIYPLLL